EKFLTPDEYLQYDFINKESQANFKNKLEVCLNELFLKAIVFDLIDPASTLPLLKEIPELKEFGFIREKVLMHFDNDQLTFTDLSTVFGKETLSRKFLPWSEVVKAFRSRHPFLKSETDIQEKLFQSAFIVKGKDIVEI